MDTIASVIAASGLLIGLVGSAPVSTNASNAASAPRSTSAPGRRFDSARRRPFPWPTTGHIAVEGITHCGDEVMKVYEV